jgi:glycosyltransferase involved in cell wall biosynthesis
VIDLPLICPDMPQGTPPPGSFEWARNESLKLAHGDWILWLDADEVVKSPHNIRKYLNTPAYNGFSIRQNHLMLDRPTRADKPIRLFRNGMGYRFFGIIHEQPSPALNKMIEPRVNLNDVDIVHTGYTTEAERRAKCQSRNIRLLQLDRQKYPDRDLGHVLEAREYVNVVTWAMQDGLKLENGHLPTGASHPRKCMERVIVLWNTHFADYKHQMTHLMFPFYQFAMRLLNLGVIVPLSLEMPDDYGVPLHEVRFQSKADFMGFMNYQADSLRLE